MLMNKWIKYGLSFGVIAIIGACSISTSMDATLEREVEATTELKEKAKMPTEIIPNDVVRVKDEIWLGDSSVIEYDGAPLPGNFEDKEGITLISNRPITLFEIGDMISKITSLSVRYAPSMEEDIKKAAEENEPTPESMNVHWAAPGKMLVSYRGPLSGLLDEVSSRFGIWWRYEKNEIQFYKYITKTFVLYSLPTQQSLSNSIGGSSTDTGGGGSSTLTLSSNANMELWKNVEDSIKSMVAEDAKLSIDSGNGVISLTATPTDIKKVAKYINEQNARLSRQVAISIKVLQVNITDTDNFGLDLSAEWSDKHDNSRNFTLASAASIIGDDVAKNLGISVMPGEWSVEAGIKALSKKNTVNLVTSGTVTTMNNKPAPIQVVKKQNYISEITKTNSGGDDGDFDISTETEEIETGFTMSVLPRILEHGRLMVMFNLTLSDLLELEKVVIGAEEDGQYIQNPIIESRGFSQEIVMKSGESLVLTGYERTENEATKAGVGSADNSLLGGSAIANKLRSILVIILTPVVLESPLNPETRVHN